MSGKNTSTIYNMLKGACMGIAEVIPGVSGGTIAFITGIYERLINAIKGFDIEAIKLLFSFKLVDFFKKIDGFFLLSLAIGMFVGIGVGVLGIGHLLENYPAPVWGFFFGLIIASALYIGNQIKKWDFKTILILLLGFGIALGITYLSPTEGSGNLLWVFLCGCIAISALILPGVSGSFILLLLGMYTVVRNAAEVVIREQELSSVVLLLSFVLGCAVGLISFARVMSYAFKNYKDLTLGLLTGFMLGSLRKIWPWRNIDTYLNKDTGEIINHSGGSVALPEEMQILSEQLVSPSGYFGNPLTLVTIICLLTGFFILLGFFIIDRRRSSRAE
jgi:putative membrane protein